MRLAGRKHSGHGQALEKVKRLAVPRRASAALGKVPFRAHSRMWLHSRVSELAHLARKVEAGELLAHRISGGGAEDAPNMEQQY